jgi:hypothetical protein
LLRRQVKHFEEKIMTVVNLSRSSFSQEYCDCGAPIEEGMGQCDSCYQKNLGKLYDVAQAYPEVANYVYDEYDGSQNSSADEEETQPEDEEENKSWWSF